MGNNQVAMQANNEQSIHAIAYVPIHQSISRIIPILEQRQEAAKRLYEYRNKLTDAEKSNYEELIKYCENEIKKRLNFT